MNKFMRRIAAFCTAAIVACSFTFPTYAASLNEWQVYFDSSEFVGWTGNGSTVFSVDKNVHTSGSKYSIRLDNNNYNTSYVERDFSVQANTYYRFSAKVKYSGYSLSPEAESDKSGACVGMAYSYSHSDFTTDSDWKTIEYFFNSGESTRWSLCLQNGIYDAPCHGTAWFSEVKLEKAEMTNNWKVLAVLIKNIDAKDANGRDNEWVMSTMSDNDAKEIKKIIKGLATSSSSPNSLKTLSGGRMNLRMDDLSIVEWEEPLTELVKYHYDGDRWGTDVINGNQMDMGSDYTDELIRKASDGRQYDQVIFVLPMYDKAGGWAGLGGLYGNQNRAQVVFQSPVSSTADAFPQEVIVHEMLHGIESRSNNIAPQDTAALHSYPDYGYKNNTEDLREYYSKYMKGTLPGGNGVVADAFKVPGGKYTLVSSDMTAGRGIEQTSTGKDISELDMGYVIGTYTGKAVTPDIVLTDVGYTLKKGVDYTVTYRDNTNIGIAYADVRGIGAYGGSRTVSFKIAPEIKFTGASLNNNKLKISWSNVSGASGYNLWQIIDGEYQVVLENTSALSAEIAFEKDRDYRFAVSAYIPEISSITDYAYSDLYRINTKAQTVDLSRSGNKLTVSWSEVPGAKYTIMKSVDGGKYTSVLKNTTKLSTVINVENGHKYKFAVKAYIPALKYNTQYGYSKAVSITSSVPKVTASKDVNKINLSWTKVSGAQSYDVWECVDGGDYNLVFSDIKDLSTSLVKPDGHSYRYAVSAYIPAIDYTTGFGKSKTVKISDISPTVTVKKNGNKITVSWSKVYGAKYNVWEQINDGSYSEVIKGTTKRSAEFSYRGGNSYCFAVVGFVSENNDFTEFGYSDWVI